MPNILDTSTTQAELADHLIAGRRAALGTLVANLPENATYNGLPPEALYPGRDGIQVHGIEVGGAIDAAVIETIVRLQHPDPTPTQRRPWWRFWR